MEMYERAYKRYAEKCRNFGIELIDIIEFIRNVPEEQAKLMLNDQYRIGEKNE